jgi:hypothetical protein
MAKQCTCIAYMERTRIRVWRSVYLKTKMGIVATLGGISGADAKYVTDVALNYILHALDKTRICA